VFPTQDTPLYSNAAYHILGYVLENIAGDTFETVLQRDVFEPLGMNNSGVRHPEAGAGVVPSGATAWDAYLGDETP
jgi:CubicO group peptidase (beta-lactamase class C family)